MKRELIHTPGNDCYATGNSLKQTPNCPLGPRRIPKEIKRLRSKQVRQKGKINPRDCEADNFPICQVGASKKLAQVEWDKAPTIMGHGKREYISEWLQYEMQHNPNHLTEEQMIEKLAKEYDFAFVRKW